LLITGRNGILVMSKTNGEDIMRQTATPLIPALLATACGGGVFPGTQIGSEGSLFCTLATSETPGDLDELPDGLSRSPREVIDILTGVFAGQQLGENEQPSGGAVSLSVTDPGSTLAIEYYEPSETADYAVDPCPPQYRFELGYTLVADGFPSFEGALETLYSDGADGDTLASSSDESLFDGEMPPPTGFQPEDWGQVEPELWLSACPGCGWYASLSWTAYNPGEVVEGEDHYVEHELLFHASLEQE
jgi:hypothetical protein